MVVRSDFGAAKARKEALCIVGAGAIVRISPFVIDALGDKAGMQHIPMGRFIGVNG